MIAPGVEPGDSPGTEPVVAPGPEEASSPPSRDEAVVLAAVETGPEAAERRASPVPAPPQDSAARRIPEPALLLPRSPIEPALLPPPEKLDGRLVILGEPDSPRAAAYRVLRHRLDERGSPRLIAISSAEAGEGKTTAAANLALALAETVRGRVLLVDTHLRRPALSALFGFAPPAELQASAMGAVPEPWTVFKRLSPHLELLALGPDAPRRAPLDGTLWTALVERARASGYERVVVDAPPVLGSADINLIEDHVDGVLLVAWGRRSRGRALRRAVEQLEPSKLLGITLLDGR